MVVDVKGGDGLAIGDSAVGGGGQGVGQVHGHDANLLGRVEPLGGSGPIFC